MECSQLRQVATIKAESWPWARNARHVPTLGDLTTFVNPTFGLLHFFRLVTMPPKVLWQLLHSWTFMSICGCCCGGQDRFWSLLLLLLLLLLMLMFLLLLLLLLLLVLLLLLLLLFLFWASRPAAGQPFFLALWQTSDPLSWSVPKPWGLLLDEVCVQQPAIPSEICQPHYWWQGSPNETCRRLLGCMDWPDQRWYLLQDHRGERIYCDLKSFVSNLQLDSIFCLSRRVCLLFLHLRQLNCGRKLHQWWCTNMCQTRAEGCNIWHYQITTHFFQHLRLQVSWRILLSTKRGVQTCSPVNLKCSRVKLVKLLSL